MSYSITNTVRNAWKLPYRRQDLPWDKAAELAHSAVSSSHSTENVLGSDVKGTLPAPKHLWKHTGSQNFDGYLTGMEFSVAYLHRLALENKLWGKDNRVDWHQLHHNQKLDTTLIYLAANVGNNLEKLIDSQNLIIKDNYRVKARKHKLLDHSFNYLEDLAHNPYYFPEIEIKGTVPGNVRWEIEYAWRVPQEHVRNDREGLVVNKKESLPWRQVAVVALDAIYSLDNLRQLNDPNVLENLAERIDEDMIHHGLWGADTNKYAFDKFGRRKLFMTPMGDKPDDDEWRQKENIVLILFAALSGFTDAMVYKEQRTFDMHKNPNKESSVY